jgi:hypothetical protein
MPFVTTSMLDMAFFFHDYWWLILPGIGAFAYIIKWSLPNTLRSHGFGKRLARMPPWSLVDTYQGAQFFDNLASLIGGGVSELETLETIAPHANPWLRHRLDGAAKWVRSGKSLGLALELAGDNFPDVATITYLQALPTDDRYGMALDRFSARWFKRSLKRITRVAFVANIVGIAATGLLLLWWFIASLGLTMVNNIMGGS